MNLLLWCDLLVVFDVGPGFFLFVGFVKVRTLRGCFGILMFWISLLYWLWFVRWTADFVGWLLGFVG